MPRRNYLGLLFNPATEVLVYFIASFYVVINYAGQNTNQSPNMNLFNKLLAISDYKWKFTDVILVGGSIVIIQLIIMFIKSLFIPTFSIKKDANKSSVLYKFSVATKEPYNFITLMIGVIGIILSIILSVLK